MRLRVNVDRPNKAQLSWTIAYANPELAGIAPVTVTAVRTTTALPIIKPAAPPADWDENRIAAAAVNIGAKQVNAGDVETFARHLSDVLIGGPSLAAIKAAGPLEAIEIASDDTEFSRLPWEMLWLDDDFAARKGVGVVRVVPARGAVSEFALEPKVLFVVGSDLNDERIRAGAEYLGLLRRLEQKGLAIESHVLARATPKRIQDTVGELRPSVIHFICHGGGRGSGYLELLSDENGKSFDRLTAEQLVNLTGGIPKAMVMNACESAGKPSLDSTSLALSMALRGTPVVVGMAGRVADRACRLFTRRFYEALATGAAIEGATSAARKDAMDLGTDPRKTVDWAMPTIFLHEGARVTFDRAATTVLERRVAIAGPIRRLTDPGLICGRGECLDAHRNLLDGRAPDRPRVLVLKTTERAASIPDPQYGKTRIVEEIGARAALRGHVPCVLTFVSADRIVKAPKTAWELAARIAQAIRAARTRFAFNEDAPYEVLRLQDVKQGRAAQDTLSALVRNQLLFDPMQPADPEPPPAVIRAALTTDLEALAADARAAANAPPDLKVVVLIDDVHACSAGGTVLVEQWIDEHGLGRAVRSDAEWAAGRGPIPVVLTYSSVTLDIYKADVDALKTYIEARPTTFRTVDLKPFDPPAKDVLPYQQFLLSRDPMLVFREDLTDEDRNDYLTLLHDEVAGVPSRLTVNDRNKEVHALVRAGVKLKYLQEADDEQALKQLAGGV